TQTAGSLPGFVSGGSIGGDTNRTQTTSSLPGFVSGGSIGGDTNRTQPSSQNLGGNTSQKSTESSRERVRRKAEALWLGPIAYPIVAASLT
ncbi:hypothetical protein Tsubulata_046915, partial [Turnera subulata]